MATPLGATGLPRQIFDPAYVSFALDYNLTATICELPETTIEDCISLMKLDFADNGGWPALNAYFNNQIDCWRSLA